MNLTTYLFFSINIILISISFFFFAYYSLSTHCASIWMSPQRYWKSLILQRWVYSSIWCHVQPLDGMFVFAIFIDPSGWIVCHRTKFHFVNSDRHASRLFKQHRLNALPKWTHWYRTEIVQIAFCLCACVSVFMVCICVFIAV